MALTQTRNRYDVGDLVIYGSIGVCRVDEIGFLDISGINKSRPYYTLSALYSDETVFTPVDTTIFMRPLISNEEAKDIIMKIPGIPAPIYQNRNLKLLEEHYQALLQSHECTAMVQIIKAVYMKNEAARKNGNKLGQTDARYMKQAEDMLYQEFAVVLGIPKDDVKGYIADSVKKLERGEIIN